ncbi:hypothetical protein [Streptomyces apricus]|uniref:Uncharacterized protein n=1 Tax=Streptomyces apricus TaxID=1828112 RepID=A0A5B0BJB7_9ACTN|nr:hypothetical protein [Streptomyces apricus]KAA0941352.1 hypothetical protein FGF04_05105 [Streptomyces apricus]
MTPSSHLRAVPRAAGESVDLLRSLSRTPAPLTPGGAEVLRLIQVQRVPVCLTVHANGRRRYGYWQSVSAGSPYGGCYVALPTDECDALHAAGRIVLGDPVTDPAKTTYPVRPVVRGASAAVRGSSVTAGVPRQTSAPARQASATRQAPAPWQTSATRPSRTAGGQALPTRRALTA